MTGFRRAIAGTAALIVGGFVVGALVGFVASTALSAAEWLAPFQ